MSEQSIAFAALIPAAAHPLGDPRRHPRGLLQPRLCHYLLAHAEEPLTLLGPLSGGHRHYCWYDTEGPAI
jgi:hypothetical protein